MLRQLPRAAKIFWVVMSSTATADCILRYKNAQCCIHAVYTGGFSSRPTSPSRAAPRSALRGRVSSAAGAHPRISAAGSSSSSGTGHSSGSQDSFLAPGVDLAPQAAALAQVRGCGRGGGCTVQAMMHSSCVWPLTARWGLIHILKDRT